MAGQGRDERADYRTAIRLRAAKALAQALRNEQRQLSGHWRAIMDAHDRTTAAMELTEAGMHHDFFLQALQDMAAVKEEADECIRELANVLVQDLNVASTTVAHTAGVSHTTIYRWLDPDREPIPGTRQDEPFPSRDD